jgi:hypothetical protein
MVFGLVVLGYNQLKRMEFLFTFVRFDRTPVLLSPELG